MPLQLSYINSTKAIMVCQLVGQCSGGEIEQMFAETVRFLDETKAHQVYRLVDTDYLTANDGQIERMINESFRKEAGSIFDNRVIAFGTGSKRGANLYREALRDNPQRPRHSVPVFPTLHEGLQFLRGL